MSHITTPDEYIEEEYIGDESDPFKGLFVHLVSIKPGITTQSHKHNSTIETIEVIQGKGFLCINGIEKEIKAGMKEIILPGQVHNFYTKAGTFRDPLLFKRIKEKAHSHDYVVA
jgi:quercetin dioxygenase-like cupin family protein